MKQKENIVAVMPEPEIMDEQQLSQQITDIEFRAESFIIQTEEDYADAGAFGKLLKQKASEVEAFFKPMKDSAYQAHKAVCSREKSMLEPLKSAEKTIKKAMSAFLMEQEAKRRAAEEKARQAAKAEMQCKLAEAEELEIAGNLQGAEPTPIWRPTNREK